MGVIYVNKRVPDERQPTSAELWARRLYQVTAAVHMHQTRLEYMGELGLETNRTKSALAMARSRRTHVYNAYRRWCEGQGIAPEE